MWTESPLSLTWEHDITIRLQMRPTTAPSFPLCLYRTQCSISKHSWQHCSSPTTALYCQRRTETELLQGRWLQRATWPGWGRGVQQSLDVLLHELLVELRPQRVIDEVALFAALEVSLGTILEHDIIIPPPFHLEFSLV